MREKGFLQVDIRLRRQIMRFLLVGGIAVGIDAFFYVSLNRLLGWDASWAKRISFAIGAIWAFWANKYFTFGSQIWTNTEPVLFVLVYAIGWAVNSAVHDVTMRLSGLYWLSFLGATGASTMANFVGQKWLVFRLTGAKALR